MENDCEYLSEGKYCQLTEHQLKPVGCKNLGKATMTYGCISPDRCWYYSPNKEKREDKQ